MAFMNQERKKARIPALKAVLNKYGVKATFSVCNHSTLVATIKSGPFDFDPISGVNHYWIESNYSGKAAEFLVELREAMYGEDYFDKSDIQSDYFHCSHYISINIGAWGKPYTVVN